MPIADTQHLEEMLSEPRDCAIRALSQVEGDIVVLGAGGKMGPSLCRMAQRASQAAGANRRLVAVSLFFEDSARAMLMAAGVETIACDLMDPNALGTLPDAPNVVFMAGMKFGTTGNQELTWALNVFLPGLICRRYPDSRIAAFSTGNVYGMVPVARGGSVETDQPEPVGEYAMSALGRERMFEHFSRGQGTEVALVRLNYSCEMRYGVLLDIARNVASGEPVSLEMGYVNAIWQADANAMALASLARAASPPFVVNVAGPEILSVRTVAERFGSLMAREVHFSGKERPDAFLSNADRAFKLFGKPKVRAAQMIEWIADWIARGGESLGKPTHFESRDGEY